MSGYNQFIYGKFYNWQSGYRLVACTSDLAQYQAVLEEIAQKEFRFWGSQPPEGNKKSVGISQLKNEIGSISSENYLVLIQTEQANQVCEGRPYTQHRYIFVPKEDVINESPVVLLRRILNNTIPVFPDKFEDNIDYFAPEQLLKGSETKYFDNKISEITSCLNDKNDSEQSLILLALYLLLNKQKLILTIEREINIAPQNFLSNILLLLPFACRNLLAIAIGNLDENRCIWANVIINTNGFPNTQKLPQNMIWLNRKTKKILPQVSSDIFEHPYVQDFLIPIDNNPDSIRRMLQYLQTLTDDEFTLDSLSKADTLAHIIPGLTPGERQIECWCKYILLIDDNEIKTIIDRNIDQESLFCLWKALEKLYKNSTRYEQLMLLVIQKLDIKKVIEILENRSIQFLGIAENLASQLFEVLNVENPSTSTALKLLCLNIVKEKSEHNELEKARKLALEFASKQNIYLYFHEKFLILDAILFGENIPKHFFISWFDNFAYLLFFVAPKLIYDSNFYKIHLDKHFPKVKEWLQLLLNNRRENLVYLLHIADEMKISPQGTDKMCHSFIKNCSGITYEESLPFLRLLISKSIDRQHKICLKNDIYPATFSWFKSSKEELNNALNKLEQNPNFWHNWYNLAEIFYKDRHEIVNFLDEEIQPFPTFDVEMLTEWMSLIENQLPLKNSFLNSYSFSTLKEMTITNFVSQHPEYILPLSRCLIEQKYFQLISGNLLKSLCQLWLNKKNIPPTELDLWNSLVSADDKSFKSNGYLELIRVSWYLKQETVISLNKVNLDDVDKKTVYDDAFKIIKDCKHWEKGQNIIDDCYALKLDKSNIQNLVFSLISEVNPQPDQIVNLLIEATNKWKLGVSEQEKIIRDIALTQKDNPLLQYYARIRASGTTN
jgi:hypothetical protein